jgi:hypothetical protein
MASKPKPRKTRASEKRKQRENALAKNGKGGEALAVAPLKQPASEIGLLRQIFKLARGSGLTDQERIELVSNIEKQIVEAFKEIAQSGRILGPKDFGAKSVRELAELFVKEIEAMDISPKTFRAFVSHMRIEGYQSRVRGKLFHLYVRNLGPLQADLLKWAMDQIEELNNPKVAGAFTKPNVKPPGLVNALGEPITTAVKFDELPFKAEKIYIIKTDGKRVEFIDDSFLSFSGKGEERFMSFLTETEVKTAAAAKGLSEQIVSAQIRTGSADTRSIVVVGRRAVRENGRIVFEETPTEIKVEPRRVVYSPRSINRSGVTLFRASRWARIQEKGEVDLAKVYESSEFSFRSTAKGGGETYLFVRLAINTDELNKIVHAILPRLPKK